MSSLATPPPPSPPPPPPPPPATTTTTTTTSGWKRKAREGLAIFVLAVAAGGAVFIPWAKLPVPGAVLAMTAYTYIVWLVIVFIKGGDIFKAIENTRIRIGTGFEDRAVQLNGGGSGAATTTSQDGAASASSQDIALLDLQALNNPDAVD